MPVMISRHAKKWLTWRRAVEASIQENGLAFSVDVQKYTCFIGRKITEFMTVEFQKHAVIRRTPEYDYYLYDHEKALLFSLLFERIVKALPTCYVRFKDFHEQDSFFQGDEDFGGQDESGYNFSDLLKEAYHSILQE